MALSILRFLCKTFSKLLKLSLQKTLFRGWFFKKWYIQIKNLYRYKLISVAKRSEPKRCSKEYRQSHTKQCKLFTWKKNWILAWSIKLSNEWKLFLWHFLLSLWPLFLVAFLFFCIFFIISHLKIIRCIVKLSIATSTYFLLNTIEKNRIEKCFFGVPNDLNTSLHLYFK